MCILNSLIAPLRLCCAAEVILADGIADILLHGRVGFLRDSRGIGTQVRDQTKRAVSFYIDTFIKLLGNTHRLLRREIKRLGGFLLQRARRERKRRVLSSLAFLHLGHGELRVLNGIQNLIAIGLLLQFGLLFLSVINGAHGLLFALCGEVTA